MCSILFSLSPIFYTIAITLNMVLQFDHLCHLLFMECFEHVLLDQALMKPSCFLHFVDDTFVVWPHGSECLNEFSNVLNDLHPNIKFTMEVENDGLPFLDVFVFQNPNGSLGKGVYKELTHTDLHLNANSFHNPSQKCKASSTSVHWARIISYNASVQDDLSHLHRVFLANGHKPCDVRWALWHSVRSKKPDELHEEKAQQ